MTAAGEADALAAIWLRYRDVVLARLDTIEHAAVHDVGSVERGDAVRAAHQLAGTVGTFGFVRATDIARQLEKHLAVPDDSGPDLPALAHALRRELAGDDEVRRIEREP